MRRGWTTKSKIDALDLAAIWPCGAQTAGLPLPPVETAETPRRARPDEEDNHGIW
jgi:hypothetical protein